MHYVGEGLEVVAGLRIVRSFVRPLIGRLGVTVTFPSLLGFRQNVAAIGLMVRGRLPAVQTPVFLCHEDHFASSLASVLRPIWADAYLRRGRCLRDWVCPSGAIGCYRAGQRAARRRQDVVSEVEIAIGKANVCNWQGLRRRIIEILDEVFRRALTTTMTDRMLAPGWHERGIVRILGVVGRPGESIMERRRSFYACPVAGAPACAWQCYTTSRYLL